MRIQNKAVNVAAKTRTNIASVARNKFFSGN